MPYRRTNYVFRSTDDGETWSAPVRCDSNNPHMEGDNRWFCPANFSEVGMAEVTDDVMDGPQSVVFEQSENKMHLLKALLVEILGGLEILLPDYG